MNVLNEGSVVLRLEFSIADAVRQRGILSVMGAALRAWWAQRPVHVNRLPPRLREDVGLPPAEEDAWWAGVDLHTYRLHSADRSST